MSEFSIYDIIKMSWYISKRSLYNIIKFRNDIYLNVLYMI